MYGLKQSSCARGSLNMYLLRGSRSMYGLKQSSCARGGLNMYLL